MFQSGSIMHHRNHILDHDVASCIGIDSPIEQDHGEEDVLAVFE